MAKINKFRRGEGGVYKCAVCGRSTRKVGDEAGGHVCHHCYELAGLQNAQWDGCFTEADRSERDRLFAACVAAGGSEERLRDEFPELMEA